jgi:hypothetical protein
MCNLGVSCAALGLSTVFNCREAAGNSVQMMYAKDRNDTVSVPVGATPRRRKGMAVRLTVNSSLGPEGDSPAFAEWGPWGPTGSAGGVNATQ